jgi:MOSC domain-containing protein YiiM
VAEADRVLPSGVVVEINLAAHPRRLPVPVERVRAIPAHGLEGDYHFSAETRPDAERDKDLTLIGAEALEGLAMETGIELDAAATRRNLLTRGIDLNELVGRAFRVGEVECEGIERCEPCSRLVKLTDEPGVLRGLVHRGGLRAAIRTEGEIAVGDPIVAG